MKSLIRFSRCACIACAVITSTSAVLHAQQRRDVPQPAVQDKLTAATRQAIEHLADSLSAERLPGDALRDKAAEGVLKGADDARILIAVRSLAVRLRDASALLGTSAKDDELKAAASALFTGVEPSAITRIASVQRKRNASASLTVPLTVVAELASQRVPVDVAVSSVESLLLKGAADADLSAFRVSIERDIKQGRAPREAVTSGVRAALNGLGRNP